MRITDAGQRGRPSAHACPDDRIGPWVLISGIWYKKVEADLVPWIGDAGESLLASFANGIMRDSAAVQAAIVQPWSNGQTEGQITKLKLVKRQMYGRAKIDLLEARLIGTP